MSIQKAFHTDHIKPQDISNYEAILIHRLQHLDSDMLHPQKKVNIKYLTFLCLLMLKSLFLFSDYVIRVQNYDFCHYILYIYSY